jgi:predicted metal-binding membrane protein
MSASLSARPADSAGLASAFAAARARLGLIALLLALAGLAWWSTVDRMTGMDQGPGTSLGTLGWFAGVWTVMMAAMMFPSVSPTVALYARMTATRSPLTPFIFVSGYLLVWAAAGVLAFGIAEAGSHAVGATFAWDRGGRWLASAILVAAAAYELTPLKDVCLGKCRSPLGFLLGSWRDGRRGALRMGIEHGAWCLGCCWALMAALFALGVMSLVWMAVISALIAAEKLLPWRRAGSLVVAAVCAALAVGVAAAPDSVPALTIPGSPAAMHAMQSMHSMGTMTTAHPAKANTMGTMTTAHPAKANTMGTMTTTRPAMPPAGMH